MRFALLLVAVVFASVVMLCSLRVAHAHNPDPNDPLQLAMPVMKVADLDKAIKYYVDVLGFHEEFRSGPPGKAPDYGSVGRGMVQFHLSTGKRGIEKGSIYLIVKDVDKLHEEYKSKGVEIVDALGDRSYQMRDFAIKTLDGQILIFGQGIEKK